MDIRRAALACAVVLFCVLESASAQLPPPCVEISPEHPLLLFQVSAGDLTDPAAYANYATQAWNSLPADLKPLSAIQVETRGVNVASRHQWYKNILILLQDAEVSTVIRISDEDPALVFPLDRTEELAHEFTCIKGFQSSGLRFNDYYAFGSDDPHGTPPEIRWLVDAIDLASRYGRFIAVELDEIGWPRVMANASCAPLRDKMRACAGYVAPIARCRGSHVIPQISALMGAWLDGMVLQWGIGPDSRWSRDAWFLSPGVYGVSDGKVKLPASLYRAMILDGVMTGATVYSFEPDSDLWFGSAPENWNESIYPTLQEILEKGLIPRQDLVKKKTRVAYELAPARTSQDFHVNLRDIDGTLDAGLMARGVYGMERPGQVSELIPNMGRFYWTPLLSPGAASTAPGVFEALVKPGAQTSPESWAEFMGNYAQKDGEGTAFITSVGRGIFVMHTAENRYEQQTFNLPAVPAAVRQFKAERQDAPGAAGVLLTWPFREGDMSYKVHKRIAPDGRWSTVANVSDERKYLDATADPSQTIAYSITALTDDKEPFEDTVDYGQYLALSTVESRIAEEVTIGPLLGVAQSKPVETQSAPDDAAPWWPNFTGLTESQAPLAAEIVKRIEELDRAFTIEDLNAVMETYSPDYEDPQGWKIQYVRKAYQWFFQRYGTCFMHRQIRRWDFAAYDATGVVTVVLYCRFTGTAVTDASGRIADVPAYFPRTGNGEISIQFVKSDDAWRIMRTDPALPNLNDILSFNLGPNDSLPLGPDQQ
jgi:hypothetical protein